MSPNSRGSAWTLLIALTVFLPDPTALGQVLDGSAGLGVEGAGSGRAEIEPTPEAAPSVLSPLEVFSDLERYWRLGATDSLLGWLAPDEVRLSFGRIGPRGGIFDHAQAGYLLADLFTFARTDSFYFVSYEYEPSEEELPEAVGHWFYRGTDGADREARVTIQLIALPEGWAITSIEAKKW